MPPHLIIPTLDDVSRHFAPIPALKRVRGPRSLRRQLRDSTGQPLSQAQLGRLLAQFRQRGYTGGTISSWERVERRRRLPMKYAMTDQARAAYHALLLSLVTRASNGRLQLKAHMGKRAWHFTPLARCRRCGQTFRPKSIRTVHCWRCTRR